jgi:hypothetical protein
MISFFQRSTHVVVAAILWGSFYLYCTEETMLKEIGGFTLHVTDLLFVLAICYSIVGAFIRWHLSLEVVLLILCGLLFISFARGVVSWGYASAGVPFRDVALFTSLIAFVYFWAHRLDVDWIFNAIILLGWGIVALSMARLVFGLTLFVLKDLDPSYEFRTLNSDAALTLGEAALIALGNAIYGLRGNRRLWYGASFLVFMIFLFISNQRTSIAATLAGLLVLAMTAPRKIRSIVVGVAVLLSALFCAVLWILWADLGEEINNYLPRSISMILLGSETYAAREGLWSSYLDAYAQGTFLDQLFGQPYGTEHLVYLQTNERFVSMSPHNGYIALLINAGAIGVFLFAYTLVVAIAKGFVILASASRFDLRYVRLAVAIIASHLVYSYGYQLGNDQGLLLAIAIFVIEQGYGSRRAITLKRAGLKNLNRTISGVSA